MVKWLRVKDDILVFMKDLPKRHKIVRKTKPKNNL